MKTTKNQPTALAAPAVARSSAPRLALLSALVLSALLGACSKPAAPDAQASSKGGKKAALTVSLVTPKQESWPDEIRASGSVLPWQEASVGTEVGGLRLTEVRVNVGDHVKKGQVLARLNSQTLEADRMVQLATLAEQTASLAQANANAERAARLSPSGALSKQDLSMYETQQKTALAKVLSVKAQLQSQDLRLSYTTVVAPDDGVISARTAAVGSVVSAGSELFKLIRQERLEWRAEVPGDVLMRLQAGQAVEVSAPVVGALQGKVRQLSPSVDVNTRNGLAYVDLPHSTLKSGLFVSGTFKLAERKVLAIPQDSLVTRDGYSWAFTVQADGKVKAVKLTTGQAREGWVEVSAGLDSTDSVVQAGAAFLNSGDTVKVVPDTTGLKENAGTSQSASVSAASSSTSLQKD